MEQDTINGWTIARKPGEITLTKGEEVITATYAHDDHELALDHAIAQAWGIDNPEKAAALTSEQKPAAIVRWSKGAAWTRFNMPPDEQADSESDAPTADQVNAFIAEQPAPTENGAPQ